MKFYRYLLLMLSISLSTDVFGQIEHVYDEYHLYNIHRSKKADLYKDVEGSPYLNDSFVEGRIYLKDSSVYKIPVRYNMYTDKMEYMMDSMIYEIVNPETIKKMELEKTEFLFLQLKNIPGYYEVVTKGKAILIQKRAVRFEPADRPVPYSNPKPERFEKEQDRFFVSTNNSEYIELRYLKMLLDVLKDQKSKLEVFIKQERIKNLKKGNLAKVINYYNTL